MSLRKSKAPINGSQVMIKNRGKDLRKYLEHKREREMRQELKQGKYQWEHTEGKHGDYNDRMDKEYRRKLGTYVRRPWKEDGEYRQRFPNHPEGYIERKNRPKQLWVAKNTRIGKFITILSLISVRKRQCLNVSGENDEMGDPARQGR